MNEYTSIDTEIGARTTIGDPDLFKMPWIYHAGIMRSYELSDRESDLLGRYMAEGGFVFADADPSGQFTSVAAHRNNLLAALATQHERAPGRVGLRHAQFERLPSDHPVYHCYFDFDMPPPGGDRDTPGVPGERKMTPWLEGLEVDHRLVAILSNKAYFRVWNKSTRGDHTRPFQFGVNLIVFALTQEGSLARRIVSYR